MRFPDGLSDVDVKYPPDGAQRDSVRLVVETAILRARAAPGADLGPRCSIDPREGSRTRLPDRLEAVIGQLRRPLPHTRGEHHMRKRHVRRGALIALALAAAVSGATVANAATSKVTPPSSISSAGTLLFCSDITYPPEEFYEGTKPVGSDIEIGTALAAQMGVKADFQNTGFDGIIPALEGKKCDAVISGMNDTADRRKKVDFTDYLSVGQSFMVKKGNPEKITSIAGNAGKTVSVEVGTTNASFLVAQSKLLVKAGKKSITVKTFPKDTDAANALATGKVDAYFGDAPVVAYYVGKSPSQFAFGGKAVNPIAVGIATRKGDALTAAMKKAVANLYADGTMTKILAKWKMSTTAMKR
jgi:polar amino acid transport system substrate-binding protein